MSNGRICRETRDDFILGRLPGMVSISQVKEIRRIGWVGSFVILKTGFTGKELYLRGETTSTFRKPGFGKLISTLLV